MTFCVNVIYCGGSLATMDTSTFSLQSPPLIIIKLLRTALHDGVSRQRTMVLWNKDPNQRTYQAWIAVRHDGQVVTAHCICL